MSYFSIFIFAGTLGLIGPLVGDTACVTPPTPLVGQWYQGNADGGVAFNFFEGGRGQYTMNSLLPVAGEGWDCSCTGGITSEFSWSIKADSLQIAFVGKLRPFELLSPKCPDIESIRQQGRELCAQYAAEFVKELTPKIAGRTTIDAYAVRGTELTWGQLTLTRK